jgi:hypothetical protein
MSPRTLVSWAMLALSLAAFPDEATADEPSLLTRARALGIPGSVAWQRLLHQRPAWGGVVSEIDGREFFLAPSGKRDPDAELEATLKAFFAPVVPGHEDDHAICRFPARLLFLDGQLHFAEALQAPACPSLSRYEAAVDLSGVSVVFAANYLNNPASAFGHTFLRLRRRRPAGSTERSERLDLGVDYIATTDTKNPVFYAFKGLTGLFPGTVRFHSYEAKLQEYGHVQRDIWEYDLSLTPHELSMLTLHLWEIESTHLDYFYLTKNCSYEVLALLEAAAPRLDLVSALNAVVVPADTIKALSSVAGLVEDVHYRPSQLSQRRAGVAQDEPSETDTALGRVSVNKAPERGHGSMRVTMGTGMTTQYGTSFATLGYRLVLHDLADPPDGEPELSEVQFFDTRMRYDMVRSVLTLDRLTFAEFFTLNPITRLEQALSWRVQAFGVRLHDRDCPDGFAHGLDGSLGGTIATGDERLAVFLMGDAYVAFSGSLDGIDGSFVRFGVGPLAGIRVRLPFEMVGVVTGNVAYLPGERLRGTYDVRATLRGSLTRDFALGVEAAMQPSSDEASLNSYLYF